MSDFSALSTALSGLNAHKQRIDVIGENIANVETPGYHRQLTHLTPIEGNRPGLFTGPGGQQGGVKASVARQWDELLDTNAKREKTRSSGLQTQAEMMSVLEAEMGTLSGAGLQNRLEQLWSSFDDLANDPNDLGVRSVVLGNVDAVTSALHDDAAIVDRAHDTAVHEVSLSITSINNLSTRIAELDRAVVAGLAQGRSPNSLLDERDSLASELLGLVSADIHHLPNGQIRLSVDGHNLVSEGRAGALTMAETPDPALAPFGYQRVAVATTTGREVRLSGGSVQGAILVANDHVPRQRAALDGVADTLVTTVNALHETGFALDGTTGRPLFDPAGTTAKTIQVSAALSNQPSLLAASDGSGALDNSIARSLAALASDPNGASTKHAELLTDLGNQVRTLTGRAETATFAAEHAEGLRQSAAGVSLDEELADLVAAQRAYEASSRMISTIDEMLETLINRTGLVGR